MNTFLIFKYILDHFFESIYPFIVDLKFLFFLKFVDFYTRYSFNIRTYHVKDNYIHKFDKIERCFRKKKKFLIGGHLKISPNLKNSISLTNERLQSASQSFYKRVVLFFFRSSPQY